MAVAFGSAGTRLLVGTASTSWALAYPSTVNAGDVLVACFVTNGGQMSGTPPTGWTQVYLESTLTNPKGGMYLKVADGSETGTVTFTVGSTTGNAIMLRYTGVDNTTPQDAAATSYVDSSGTGTTTVLPSITLANAGSMLVYMNGANSGSVTMTSGTGTERVDHVSIGGTGTKGGAVYDELVGSSGATGTRTITLNSGRALFGAMLALREDQGGPPAFSGTLTNRVAGISSTPSTSVRVSVKTSGVDSVRLKLGTNSGLTTGVVYGSAETPDANGYSTLTATGLTANTRYYYRVEMTDTNSVVELDTASTIGRIKTAPSGQASFAFDFGSCQNSTDPIVFPLITARADDLFFHLGDMFYNDGSGTTLSNIRSKLEGKIQQTNSAALYAQINSIHVPGDHDIATNDETNATDPTAWGNYRTAAGQLFPDEDLYYTFVWGRVRFIKLDLFNFKDDPADTDDSSKTALGTTQKQWLKDTIDAATEPAIVIVQSDPWIGSAITSDSGWFGFTTERTELANYMVASGKNFIMLGGDMHAVAADDGTHAAGNITVFQAAPFGQTASQKGGPYTTGPFPSSGTAFTTQYGRVVVTDNGTDIEFAFNGYDSTDTSVANLTKSFDLTEDNVHTEVITTFENGSDGAWAPSVAGAGTTSIQQSDKHDGVYGASANVPAATVDKAGFITTFVDSQQATISGWWKVTTEGASSGSNVPFARLFEGSQRLADVYRQNQQGAGANVWLRVVKAAGGSNYWFIPTGYNLPLDTWVYISFTWGLDGNPSLWIDGVEYIGSADAPADWFAASAIDTAYLGTHEPGNQGAWSMDTVTLGLNTVPQTINLPLASEGNFSGSGTLTKSTTPGFNVNAPYSSTGTLSSTRTLAISKTVAFSGSGTLTASVVPNPVITKALSGSGTLGASGTPDITAVGLLASAGLLSGEQDAAAISKSVALSGTGTLSRAVVANFTASMSSSSTGTLTTATDGMSAQAVFLGTGSGTLTGSAITPAISKSVAFSSSGTLSSTRLPAFDITKALSGVGDLTASTSNSFMSDATLSGSGTLSGAITGMSLTRSVALSGSGTLTPGTVNNKSVSVDLSGSGAFAPFLTSTGTTQSASLSGSGTLSGTSVVHRLAFPQLSGSGTLTAVVKPGAMVEFNQASYGLLVVELTANLSVAAALSGVGTLAGDPDDQLNYEVFAYLGNKRWSSDIGSLRWKGSL